MWKITVISSGETLKAGFEYEEGAREWLKSRTDIEPEDHALKEMDAEEEEAWLDAQESGEIDEEAEIHFDDHILEADGAVIGDYDDDGDDDDAFN